MPFRWHVTSVALASASWLVAQDKPSLHWGTEQCERDNGAQSEASASLLDGGWIKRAGLHEYRLGLLNLYLASPQRAYTRCCGVWNRFRRFCGRGQESEQTLPRSERSSALEWAASVAFLPPRRRGKQYRYGRQCRQKGAAMLALEIQGITGRLRLILNHAMLIINRTEG